MQASDILPLQAFTEALINLDQPLDPDIEARIIQVVKDLLQIAQKCPPLQEQFDKDLMELYENHQSQARRAAMPDQHPSSQEPRQKMSTFLRESPLFGADLDFSRNTRVNVP
jgi:hypothetical protein